ncbi:MAG: hypothetical protein EZS28_008831, partial [Streblomastix strix]
IVDLKDQLRHLTFVDSIKSKSNSNGHEVIIYDVESVQNDSREKIVATEISNDESGERAIIDMTVKTRKGKSKLKRSTVQIENEDLKEDSESEDTQSEQIDV